LIGFSATPSPAASADTPKDRRKSVNVSSSPVTVERSDSTGGTRELKRNTSLKRHSSSKDVRSPLLSSSLLDLCTYRLLCQLRQSVSKEDSLSVTSAVKHRERIPSGTFQPIKGSPSTETMHRKESSRSVDKSSGDLPSRGGSASSLSASGSRPKRDSVHLGDSGSVSDIPSTGSDDMNKLRDDLKHYRAERDYFRNKYKDAEDSNKRKADRLKEMDEEHVRQKKKNEGLTHKKMCRRFFF